MIKLIKDELKHIKETPADLRKSGITVGVVLLIIAVIVYFTAERINYYLAVPALILIITGLVYPKALKPFNKGWMIFAITLGIINSRLLLSIIFFLVITPTRFAAMLFGKKFLSLELDKNKDSYWEKREKRTIEKIDLERQF